MEELKPRGGKRLGAGRKPKADEQTLAEMLSPFEISAHEALKVGLESGKDWAVKLFFQYKYGMPKQVIDQTTTHSINDFDIKDIVNFK